MEIIELRGGGYSARINLSRGANCIALRNETYGATILREPDYNKGLDNPYLYGMPVLFPVNRISGGSFEFEGRTYRFPINEPATNCFLHGELHRTPFSAEFVSDNRVTAVYRATKEQPYLEFPHEFTMEITYELTENGLEHRVRVTNLSDRNMPLLLGFHTTFRLPFLANTRNEELRVKVDLSEEYERNMATYLPTGICPAPDDVTRRLADGSFIPNQPISRHYRRGDSAAMAIVDQKAGLSVVYENSMDYGFRLIYSDGMEYICLEPQTCLANCANSPFPREKAGFSHLEPGQSREYWSRIGIR